MSTLPSPPFISIPSLPNLRTVGAHTLPCNKQTRAAYIYRSGAPSHPTPTDISALHALHISKIYDLRSAPEIAKHSVLSPATEIAGIERVCVPVFQEEDYSPESIAVRYRAYASKGSEGFVRAYTEILDHGVAAYRTVFEHVRDRPREPFLIHCTAGKDRTGVLVALMLKLVGVGDREVADEYALTELGLAGVRERMVAFVMGMEELKGDEEGVRNMLSARKENMIASLDMLESRYGGAEGYLRGKLGFGDEDLRAIRANIIEEIPI